MAVTGKAFDFNLLKRVYTYVTPYKKTFYTLVFITIGLAFVTPLVPLLIGNTVDIYIKNKDKQGLLNIILIMVFLLLLRGVMQYFQTYLSNTLGQTVIKDLRKKLLHKIVNFNLKYFDHTPIGTLITRVVSDMET